MAKEMDLDLSDSLYVVHFWCRISLFCSILSLIEVMMFRESSSDSEDDSKRRQEQKIKNKIQTLKNQLKEILQKPVVPQGPFFD